MGATDQPLILAVVGPTAVGKTDVGLALADRFPVSLISLDSAMVYREMDIGTAKPTAEILRRHPHALVDIRDPADPYSAAEFLRDADAAVRAALKADRTPLLVGGSMMYLKTFREGLAPMPTADPATRKRLLAEAAAGGVERLFERLQQVDPTASAKIHPNNFTRIQRALEVHDLTGLPISSFWSGGEHVGQRLAASLREFAIEPDSRQALHLRIEQRLDAMLAGGFVDEVGRLKCREDLHLDLPSMRAVGYRQVWEHLDGRFGMSEMREKALAATRQLAKRQLTWLRGWQQLDRLEWASADSLAAEIAGKLRLEGG